MINSEAISTLILKKASPMDAPALFLIRYGAYLPQYGTYSQSDDPCTLTEDAFTALISRGDTYCIMLGDHVIGGLQLETEDDYVTVKEIYVHPDFRRMGAAQKALLHGEVLLPSAKYRAQVISGDIASYNLLIRMGFRPMPEYTQKSDKVTLLHLEKNASSRVTLALEPLNREQLSQAVTWCNSDHSRELYCPLWQSSREKILTMTEFARDFALGRHFVGAEQLDFAVKAAEFDRVIGIVSLKEIDWEQYAAAMDHLILDPKWRKVSLGRRTLRELSRIASEQYGIRHLRLTVLEENQPAINCFLKSGFTENSRKQNIMRGGDDQVRTRIVMTYELGENPNESDA